MHGWLPFLALYLAIGAGIGIGVVATVPSGAPASPAGAARFWPVAAVASSALLWAPAILVVLLIAAAVFVAGIVRRAGRRR